MCATILTIMTNTAAVAPSPEVQYLPAIFRRIQAGDIRMPAFQRGFVWDRKQVIELLESIFEGFPIGSVLLWKAHKKELNLETPEKSTFPRLPEKFPTNYILDGLQRLSTLYAVFHYTPELHDKKFHVAFDLDDKEFVPGDDTRKTVLPLNVLFRPTDFIRYHSELASLRKGPELIKSAVDLLSTFQEYLVPIVTIEGRSASDVVKIFERINSTGTRLSAVDFMRAVTWSEDFDLNQALGTVSTAVASPGADVEHETLVKVIAIALGYAPTSDSMLQLRDLTANKLREGAAMAGDILQRTLEFLRSQLHIPTPGLVPYEAQFLALVGFNRAPGQAPPAASAEVARWFWTASLNEDMQGRSEHQVARIVQMMEQIRVGNGHLDGRLTVTPEILKERRFRWGAALSSALVGMLANNAARSLVTGEILDTNEFLPTDSGARFVSLADERQVAAAVGKPGSAGKFVANTIAAAIDDVPLLRRLSAGEIVKRLVERFPDTHGEILASQFINGEAADALLKNEPAKFLDQRAAGILAFASNLAFPSEMHS